ncbi:MAG: hypothetical protein CGU28_10415 [Candidatus Dactylopiibacterium carminicum]|uniref:Uncharacterized protein n=1 Tax=Candidatus Dactylopiibacterium carminicum TaxID=857335 RepID=A0A272EQM8_9RHOO|nr:hypothetical protein [Candidatus Dactylopiibacterium carminicum]KAF7598651.1 hypothetical protein BGI27_12285 [Candidatus Dactylopiibacterium carminicum]PAS92417.1 MAG: hypothetical protein CGU29_11840 [Candidatus Dactylopiibacterium carminicum]PAS95990.1 MAG: hypothetical protein CGU28_10415 [Candidatus Dactylopiibacterium carminicum]PAS98419.1 MAG: hypothetical protein BSR46_12300 [Candidatus Dactylopiibacterium carminicum]
MTFAGGTAATNTTATISGSTVELATNKGKFESAKEGYAFAGQTISGDFTITATVANVTGSMTTSTSHQYRAGVMLGDTTDSAVAPVYAHSSFGVLSAGSYSYIYASRVAVSGSVSKGPAAASAIAVTPTDGSLVLRLNRTGLVVTLSYSTDKGSTFTSASPVTFAALPDSVSVGVFAATGGVATITFSNITITQP